MIYFTTIMVMSPPRRQWNLRKAYSWIKHIRITLTEDIEASYVKQINIRRTIWFFIVLRRMAN